MYDMLSNTYSNQCDFIKDMVIHHQIACDMAKTIFKHTNDIQIMDLARNIIYAQTAEIVTLRSLLTSYQIHSPLLECHINNSVGLQSWSNEKNWDVKYASDPINIKMNSSMQRMHTGKYAKTNKYFLIDMILHHEIAVIMARRLLNHKACNPSLSQICRGIIWQQTLEISYMKRLLIFKFNQEDNDNTEKIIYHNTDIPLVTYYEPNLSTDKNIKNDKCWEYEQ